MTRKRALVTVVAVIVLLPILAIGALVLVAQSQWGERWLERQVASRIHREVQIEGIRVHLGWPPAVSFEKLRISNPEWAQTKSLVDANGLSARVEIPPLLHRRIVIPLLQARSGEAGLEQKGDQATWRFGDQEKAPSAIDVRTVMLEDGRILYRDADEDTAIDVSVKGSLGENGELRFDGAGKFRGDAVKATATVPGLTANPVQNVRVIAKGSVGRTQAAADGSFTTDLRAMDLKFDLKGQTLKDLHKVTGIVLPDTPPYSLSGRLRREGEARYVFDPFSGKIGDSDIAGAVTYEKIAKRRPAFWDGGRTWKIRFASPLATGRWSWTSSSSAADAGLAGQSGALDCAEPPHGATRFERHGFWRMSPGRRSLVHADGKPALLAADTAWGLPWRATVEQCRFYAADRQAKGFNAALLMSVQPDMDARGPRDRTADEGFDVGFEDLSSGHINQPNPAYFQYLDQLLAILAEHEIVPVLQPVFMGFGWKGLRVAGPVLPPAEYARYCRYLVARYGARPAIYLVGGDGSGYEPQVPAGGAEIEQWDAYSQPTGIHYRPHADNRAWQDAFWLDFQWCQTGHSGEHMPERVADMWRNLPAKGVANGEPTYEHGRQPGRAAGWWQGHEAWSNLCAGGTMGVVYGAGSLWQWAQRPDEPGQSVFFLAAGAGWREALDFEGSRYVGIIPRILDGLPFADMQPNWQVTLGRRGLLVPGRLFICYAEQGGPLMLFGEQVPRRYRAVDPRTGVVVREGTREPTAWLPDEGGAPRLYIFCDEM